MRVGHVKRGTLILVVGPSGVGKDSLLDGAQKALNGSSGFDFPRRIITRPESAGGEDHIALTQQEFLKIQTAGAFALAWQAHGLCYGIPISIEEDLAYGRNVVVNVSRAIIDEARAAFAPVKIIYVTVPDTLLAERLRARGRESESDILKRLQQANAYDIPNDTDTYVLDNDGPLEKSVRVFVALLLAIARNDHSSAITAPPGRFYG